MTQTWRALIVLSAIVGSSLQLGLKSNKQYDLETVEGLFTTWLNNKSIKYLIKLNRLMKIFKEDFIDYPNKNIDESVDKLVGSALGDIVHWVDPGNCRDEIAKKIFKARQQTKEEIKYNISRNTDGWLELITDQIKTHAIDVVKAQDDLIRGFRALGEINKTPSSDAVNDLIINAIRLFRELMDIDVRLKLHTEDTLERIQSTCREISRRGFDQLKIILNQLIGESLSC